LHLADEIFLPAIRIFGKDVFVLLNQRMRTLICMLAVIGFCVFFSSTVARAGQKLDVFVSIAPQKYFVQQIGKERVNVQVMVQPGANPATYEPRPRQMAALSKTRIYFAIGVAFEKAWLGKIAAASPKLRVVHTDHGIQKIPMATHHYHAEHDAEKNHHGEPDPHIWLSPTLVITQARTILNALAEIDPNHRSVYEANINAFVAELAALDADLRDMFASQPGRQFMVFHPAWGYFAHAYGLKQVPVEIEGKDPKPAQLKALIEHAQNKHIKVIFAQPQFSSRSADLVAKEIGGRVIFVDPLASDWSANLREVAQKFKAALK
jgi:zinc transport system substrate-binding protein